jgi:hypothetical protein
LDKISTIYKAGGANGARGLNDKRTAIRELFRNKYLGDDA